MKFKLKYLMYVLGALVLFVIALNSFTVVDQTKTKVKVCFGKVDETQVYTSGVHLVNPLCSFDEFNTGERKYEVLGLTIPTQDRFNSTANVTVLFNIIPSKTIGIRSTYGNEDIFIETALRQHLRSVIRDEGRKIKDSRGLAQSDSITNMQESASRRMTEALTKDGMNIRQVLIQDITFDPRIAQQILKTQERIQREEAEKSQTQIIMQKAQQAREQQTGLSDAKKIVADEKAYSIREQAKAKATSVRELADANRYAIEQVAEANEKLNKTLTQPILRKQELDNEAILYGRSKGNVPHTVIGETKLRAYGIPLTATK